MKGFITTSGVYIRGEVMKFKKGDLLIKSDFDIRTLREDGEDIDILIPIDNRTVNLHIKDMSQHVNGRLQFPMVRNMIVRFSISSENNTATIHLLRSIDLQSSVVNFIVDYTDHSIEVKKEEYSVEINI